MKVQYYIALLLVYIFYAGISVIMKWTGIQDPLSPAWVMGLGGLILTLGIYAIAWQQILKRVALSTAYMFKGVSLIFVMLFLFLCFDEPITPIKLLGTLIIVLGIGLYAKG